MLLSTVAFQVLFLIQKLVPLPFLADTKHQRLVKNPFNVKQRFYQYKLFSEFIVLFLLFPITLFRIGWQISNWKSYTISNLDELMIYSIIICFTLIYLPVCILFHTESKNIIEISNNCCQLTLIDQNSPKNNTEALFKKFKPILAYCIFVPFTLIVLACSAASFAFSFLPFNLVLGQSLVAKVVASLLYGIMAKYGGLSVLATLLLSTIWFEHLIVFTGDLRNIAGPFHKAVYKKFHRYRMAEILLKLSSSTFSPFFTNLIFVGIVLSSCGAYWTVKMYSKVYLILYMIGPVISSLGIVIAIGFTYMTGLPCKNLENFKKFLIIQIQKKEERKVLRSLNSCGFHLGPYGIARSKLGLHICDEIIRNTVTVLLLDSS